MVVRRDWISSEERYEGMTRKPFSLKNSTCSGVSPASLTVPGMLSIINPFLFFNVSVSEVEVGDGCVMCGVKSRSLPMLIDKKAYRHRHLFLVFVCTYIKRICI